MAHDRKSHPVTDEWGHELKITTSFWQDEDEPRIASVLSIDTGMAHLQISTTVADLRALAAFFNQRAIDLAAFQVANVATEPATTEPAPAFCPC